MCRAGREDKDNTSGCFCNQSVARRPDSNPSQSLRAAAQPRKETREEEEEERHPDSFFKFPAYTLYVGKKKIVLWGNTSEGGVTFWIDEIISPRKFTHTTILTRRLPVG